MTAKTTKTKGKATGGQEGGEAPAQGPEVQEVDPRNLKMLPEFQARAKVNRGTVVEYTRAWRGGAEFPPIQVALVAGVPCVVDGWHRVQAAIEGGVLVIPAVVTKTTKRGALRLAAMANRAHGLPLKPGERQEQFRLFIRGNGHARSGKGNLMSYREIAKALGGSARHTSIVNWMRRDFPKIAEAMGKDPADPPLDYIPHDQSDEDDDGDTHLRRGMLAEALGGVEVARKAALTISDPADRQDLLRAARALVSDLEAGKDWSETTKADF
jgi:hypothetical protein